MRPFPGSRYAPTVADVRPFTGVTYEPARIPDLGLVTCPPYDVISPADRDMLYDRHPYNAVRIVSGRDEEGDTDERNKYTRACGFFRSWLWEGMLHEDPRPALYVYRQAFDDPTGKMRRVWGIVGTISLDDPILAHEKTMSGPKADRLALMKALPANISPIYALYREDGGSSGASPTDGTISSDLSSWSSEPPVGDFTDDEGTRHTVWAVHDEAFHDKVRSALASSPLLIADGHHRFETAKAYRDARRAEGGPGPWDNIMTLLVDAGAQPLLILPYHRIVRTANTNDPLPVVSETFDVSEVGPADEAIIKSFERSLWDADAAATFGMIFGGKLYRLVAPPEDANDIPAGVLSRRALVPLGIHSVEEGLSFTPDSMLIADEVAAGRAVCGFLIPPVPVERVWEHASSGGKMPEKSTYFHPKPRDGIVIRPLEPC
jgi:uncharacterized protein (DUF1015 family)